MRIEPVRFEINEYETLCGDNLKTIVRLPEKIRLFQKRLNLRRERVKKLGKNRLNLYLRNSKLLLMQIRPFVYQGGDEKKR